MADNRSGRLARRLTKLERRGNTRLAREAAVSQRHPRRFTPHHQGEDDERQDDGDRQDAQTPAQRTGLDHDANFVRQTLRKSESLLLRKPPGEPARPQRVDAIRRATISIPSYARSGLPATRLRFRFRRGTAPRQPKALSGKRRRLSPYADDDPSLVVQDLDLPPPFALYLRHMKYPTPDSLEIGRQVTLTTQPRAVSANEAEFIIRHGLPRVRCYRSRKRMERTKVPRARKMLRPAQRSQSRDEGVGADFG